MGALNPILPARSCERAISSRCEACAAA